MIINLYQIGFNDPLRTYENIPKACSKVRGQWIKDVKNLPGGYYIDIQDTNVTYNVNEFQRELDLKLINNAKYLQGPTTSDYEYQELT